MKTISVEKSSAIYFSSEGERNYFYNKAPSMKRFFLSITLVIVFSNAYSQACIPVWVDTGYGISPDTIINLPPAYVSSSYTAIVQFKVPDTVTTDLYTGPINHIVLTN